jgi:hypothetical protein
MPAVLCSQVCGLFGAEHMPCALYRHFDKDENLLYVGCSARTVKKLLKECEPTLTSLHQLFCN